jgi:hypothetical protein
MRGGKKFILRKGFHWSEFLEKTIILLK